VRLAAKITLIMMLGIAAILSIQAVLHVRGVLKLHGAEVRDDLVILGRTLGTAVTEIWNTSNERRAQAYVRRADSRRARTRINLVDRSSLPTEVRRELARSNEPVVRQASEKRLVAYTPIGVHLERPAVLKLSRLLTDERAYIQGVVWTQVGTTVLLVLVSTVLSMLLGLRLVGRRVELLIGQARRVGRGEFIANRDVRRDELGLLAHEMNRMTDRLEAAQSQAREERHARTALLEQLRHADRLSTIGRLASSIAHQLGTPLNVVAGRAGMIASGEIGGDEARESARIVAEQSQQMTLTIRQLLDFSRGPGLRKATTPIASIIEQAVTLMEPLADKHRVSIVSSDHRPIEAEVDSGKVLQVLTNLMMNGIQAMPDGGALHIQVREDHVEQPDDIHAAAGHYVCIEIQDEGVGISPDGTERIFEPFFTTKREGEGTGLGLPVCHGIVREHGGWIAVESAPDVGSCFSVYLPKEADA
jgi:signal transduction histidine kinase